MHTQNTITISRSILMSLAFCCKQIMSLRNVKLLLLMEFVLARIRELCFLIVETIAAQPAAVMSNGTITRVTMKQVWRRLCRTPGHFRRHFRSLSIFSTSIRNDTGKPTAKQATIQTNTMTILAFFSVNLGLNGRQITRNLSMVIIVSVNIDTQKNTSFKGTNSWHVNLLNGHEKQSLMYSAGREISKIPRSLNAKFTMNQLIVEDISFRHHTVKIMQILPITPRVNTKEYHALCRDNNVGLMQGSAENSLPT